MQLSLPLHSLSLHFSICSSTIVAMHAHTVVSVVPGSSAVKSAVRCSQVEVLYSVVQMWI